MWLAFEKVWRDKTSRGAQQRVFALSPSVWAALPPPTFSPFVPSHLFHSWFSFIYITNVCYYITSAAFPPYIISTTLGSFYIYLLLLPSASKSSARRSSGFQFLYTECQNSLLIKCCLEGCFSYIIWAGYVWVNVPKYETFTLKQKGRNHTIGRCKGSFIWNAFKI